MSGSISPAQPLQAASALDVPNLVPIPGHVPLRGIALMLGATLFFASTDTITKTLTAALPAVEIAWLRYVIFTLIATTALLHEGGGAALRSHQPTIQILRGFGMVASALLFTLGLRFVSVAEATAIYFVSPILITALAIPVLGERIGWRHWTAALIGLVGVLIVIRPGTGAFDSAALFPLLGATCWAGAAVVTRKVSTEDRPVTTMVYSALVGLLVLSALLPFKLGRPVMDGGRVRDLHRAALDSWALARRARLPRRTCLADRPLRLCAADLGSPARLCHVRISAGWVHAGRGGDHCNERVLLRQS